MEIMKDIRCLHCKGNNCIPKHDHIGWTACIHCGSTKNSIPNAITKENGAKYSKYD